MAGYSKVYFVGATGGFMGADGLARPFFQIMVGDGSRQWLEVVYDAASQASVAAAEGPLAAPLPKRCHPLKHRRGAETTAVIRETRIIPHPTPMPGSTTGYK